MVAQDEWDEAGKQQSDDGLPRTGGGQVARQPRRSSGSSRCRLPSTDPGGRTAPSPSGLAPHHPKERGLPPEYGGLKGDQVKRLKSLETENQRLRRAISDPTLEKLILKEAAAGPEGQRQQNF